MTVWDLFPFNDELDLLELRLRELDPVVDVFGVVEMPKTFSGLPKPLHLTDNLDRFARWKDKIRIYVPLVIPEGRDHIVDWFQRRQLSKHIINADANDLVMLSDLDEIPNRKVVQMLRAEPPETPIALSQALYYYRVDLQDHVPWSGTIAGKRSAFGPDPDMQNIRHTRCVLPQIPDAGWHFSWMGTPDQIVAKYKAVVDIDVDQQVYGGCGLVKPPENDPAFFANCIARKTDLFGRKNRPKHRVPILPGINQPHEITEWLQGRPDYLS